MAIDITTNFTGTVASQYWIPNFFEAETIQSKTVSVWDGIKSKVNIRQMNFTGGLQKRVPTPSTPNGTVTQTEKVLEPLSAMLYIEYDPEVLEQTWESTDLSTLMLDRNLPAEFRSYFMYIIMRKVFGQDMEVGWWMSSTDFQAIEDPTDPRFALQFCDGFMKRLVLDPTTLNYASPATITTSNIATFLNGLLTLIINNKKGLVNKFGRMKFFMSVLTHNIYREFLLTPTYKGIDYPNTTQKTFAGYEIVALTGFPDDTIIFCEGTADFMGALHIGMNSTGDENTLKIERTRPQDETWFVKALMKFNTQIKFANEIAMVTTLTAADFEVA